jgi:hypothetical protein
MGAVLLVAQLDTTNAQLLAPINVSATLVYYGNVPVWSGASNAQDASTAALTCTHVGGLSWTNPADSSVLGRAGTAFYTDNHLFNGSGDMACSQPAQLRCLQQ